MEHGNQFPLEPARGHFHKLRESTQQQRELNLGRGGQVVKSSFVFLALCTPGSHLCLWRVLGSSSILSCFQQWHSVCPEFDFITIFRECGLEAQMMCYGEPLTQARDESFVPCGLSVTCPSPVVP